MDINFYVFPFLTFLLLVSNTYKEWSSEKEKNFVVAGRQLEVTLQTGAVNRQCDELQ